MSDLAKAGVNQLIDVVDHATEAAITALRATKDVADATIQGGTRVVDATLDSMIDEAETLRQEYLDALRQVANATTDIVPLP